MTDPDRTLSIPSTSGNSGAWAPARPEPRATVYGPAVVGTVRVDDPRAIAALRAARAPELPAAPPLPAQPTQLVPMRMAWQAGVIEGPAAPRTPRLAIVGAVLAVTVPPVGCVVSAIALGHILGARPRPRGEALAAVALATSIIAMVALVVALA